MYYATENNYELSGILQYNLSIFQLYCRWMKHQLEMTALKRLRENTLMNVTLFMGQLMQFLIVSKSEAGE